MALSPSGHAEPFAGGAERQHRLVTLTGLLTCCAVVASAGWGPAMVAVARALRPYQLADIPRYRDEVDAAVAAAVQHMWIMLLASFLAILTLAGVAMLLGRWSLRTGARARSLVRLEQGAIGSLVGGLALWLGPVLLSSAGGHFYLPANWGYLLTSLPLAGAVGSVMLSGIALGHAGALPEPAIPHRQAWHRGARLCLVVAPVIILAVFFIFSWLAVFTVAFYLHSVY
jgi:hypothetical protein